MSVRLLSHVTQQEKYDESEKLYKEALEIRLKVLGDDHPDYGDDV